MFCETSCKTCDLRLAIWKRGGDFLWDFDFASKPQRLGSPRPGRRSLRAQAPKVSHESWKSPRTGLTMDFLFCGAFQFLSFCLSISISLSLSISLSVFPPITNITYLQKKRFARFTSFMRNTLKMTFFQGDCCKAPHRNSQGIVFVIICGRGVSLCIYLKASLFSAASRKLSLRAALELQRGALLVAGSH